MTLRIASYAALTAAVILLAAVPTASGQRAPRAAQADTIVIGELPYAPYAGTTLRLSATVRRSSGDTVPAAEAAVVWDSDRVPVAWVADNGVLNLLEPGEVTIAARSGLARSVRRIVVQPNAAARVSLVLDVLSAASPDGVRLVTHVWDATGREMADARVHLAVSARGLPRAARASITEDGRFRADEPGVYTIIAAVGTVSDQLTLLVAPPAGDASSDVPAPAPRVRAIDIEDMPYQANAGTSVALHAAVRTERSSAAAAVTWSSSNTDVALVDANGVVAFRAPGNVRITAEAGGHRAARHFVVRAIPSVRMALTVNSRDIRAGDAVRLREEVWAPGGTPIRDAHVNFAVVAHGPGSSRAVSISDDRVFVAREPGVYTIIAELGGQAQQTTVVVRAGQVARSARGR